MTIRTLCSLLLLALGGAAQALPQWQPIAADPAKAVPAHLAAMQHLPPGSVTRMQASSAKSALGEVWIVLPDGARYRLVEPQRIEHGNGDITVSATLERAGALFPLVMTIGREASFGNWSTPQGEFRFESWGDQGWLIDLGHPELRVEDADSHAITASSTAKQQATAVADKNSTTVIDVMFIYSAGFSARYPGSASATRINHLVAVANQLFASSAVPLVLRLSAAHPTAYPDSAGDNGLALRRMRDAMRGESVVPEFANLLQLRQNAGADLVTLIWPHDIETRGSCGIAYLFGNDSAHGVNVVSDGFDSWSLCSEETYAHEVGHNLGAEHQNGANSANAGFGTAHVIDGQLHTVMGSFGSGDPDRYRRVHRFSNPDLLCGGRPCGVANHSDNARRLRDNMAAVAAYLPAPAGAAMPQVPAALDPDSDGDGVPDSQDAFPFDARYHSDRDGDGVPDQIDAFPDDPTEWSDTNGNGIGDNSDPDIDGDGVANALDAFPYDPTEWADSDGDGVGDNADAFPFDRREWRDSSGDGVGDNAAIDADGDGIPDLMPGDTPAETDLLVVSAGTDRVLRLDGDSGLFAGIELADQHNPQAFGHQSALAFNPHQKLLYALTSSELRRYDRAERRRVDTFIAGHRRGPRPGFPSGFPLGLALTSDGTVLAVDGSTRSLLRHDAITGVALPGGQFGQSGVLAHYPRASALADDSRLWTLERDGRLSEFDVASGALLRRFAPSFSVHQPTALAVGPDGALYLADALLHRVLRVDPAQSGASTAFVALGAGGLQAPTGLAFGADGHLYVSDSGNDRILRFDGSSGAFIDVFSRTPPGVLQQPRALLFVPRVADRFPRDAERRYRPVAGGWANPERLGHGFDLQLSGDLLSVIWYTFRADGSPTWYLAAGPLRNGSWNAALLEFHWNGSAASHREVGQARIDFAGERSAVFAWTLPGSQGSEPIEPLAVGTSSETQFPTAAWYPPSQDGWGLSITRQGEVDYVIAFIYDQTGAPSWMAGATLDPAEPSRYTMQLFDGPTRCPGCPGAADASAVAGGSLQFEILDFDAARVSSAMHGGGINWQVAPIDFSRLTESP
jgi:hypothetical protein